MFKQNIFINNVEKSVKIVAFIIVFIITINLILGIINTKQAYATQERIAVSNKLNNYPGYIDLINKLKAKYPNWNFKILYTGLDWNQVIKNETTAWHGRNLIDSSKTGDWICPTCNDKKYDNGSWRCASEATVSYYMDPRNFLNDDAIFQFEEAVFNSSIHTVDGVMKMTEGTFLAGKENADAIISACKNVNINPYQVVSRLLQEQGKSGSIMSKGNNGFYNVFNVNASGKSASEIIANATEYAKKQGWDTLAKSILGGIDFLKSKYIGLGQNTFYLQKFDVDNTDGSLYQHQYMQNVSAAYTEGMTVKNIYNNLGIINNSISFVIPVYENMPKEISPIPGTQTIVTQNVKITGSNVNIRSEKNAESEILATLNTGDVLLRIEVANTNENGYYWDKVVLSDGRKGYVANNLIQKVDDVTNCNESVIANTSVNLRNGPGTSGTSVITTLIQGQALTKIETGKYNGLDGYDWDRVKLADGRQGYIASKFIEKVGTTSSNGTTSGELVKVVTNIGINVREMPGTEKKVLTYVSYGSTLTRVEKGVSDVNGYTWDKIVTSSGIEGYIARGKGSENYVESVSDNSNENEKTTSKALGDVNGDGKITPTDYSLIKDYIMGKSQLTDEQKKYADYNKDGKITPTDYALIKDYIMR